MSDILAKISTAVIEGKIGEIKDLTEQALSERLSAKEVLDNGLMKGMDYVGVQFKKGEMFVPEVLLSARVMQASMEILKPRLIESGAKMAGKMVIGTVEGDLHDIGKNLVAMMIEGAGFEVIDLGNNVPPQTFVDAVKENKPEIVGMSALLTTTMRAMGHTINALKEAGLREEIKIMVGGAPVTSDFAAQIGADAYCSNAPTAVDTAKKWAGTA